MHLQRSRLKIKSSGFKWGKREFFSRKKKTSTGGMLLHRRYFTVEERKFLIDFERGSFSRGGTWKLIILSAAFRRRERQPSNRQVNRRLLLVHVKRFVPQNIEFVVYRRTTTPSHPRFTGINFRLSAINRPVYLGKLANQWKVGNIRDSIYNWAHCH